MFPLAEELRDCMLSNISSARPASGGDVIVFRCPYCGDSMKHSSSAHMYVSMPTETSPALYYCHLCHCSGVVTHRTLAEWGCYDSSLADAVYQHNINVSGTSQKRRYKVGSVYNISNDMITNDKLSHDKMKYINDRLGTNLGPNDFMNLKIVINLSDLLNSNGITKYTRDINIMRQLDTSFVGFLSLDNGFVTLRKFNDDPVYETINTRYVNYRIFSKQDTSERFYVVPQKIDLLNPGRIKLHIAEGAFDILSIYLNLRHCEPGIYSSVSGSNYSAIISYFMMERQIPNLEIHLYPDADQQDYKIDKIVKDFDAMRAPIYIHRNIKDGEKDFGVPLNRINEVVRKANIWE